MQERETYEEKNETAGMNLSWNAATIQGERKFTRPTIGVQASQDDVSSHYRSAREQSGIFAGNNGFDIYVGKHTDLKGAVLASDAAAEKNILSTGTFSFGDLKNEAGYESKGIGFDYNHYADYDAKSIREKNALYNSLGLTPNISMPAKGEAKSTTKSAVAPATIEVRESPHQDLSALSRDTENSLNELGRIFDKKKIEERQELARVFGEEAFRLAHNLKDDGSGRKILIHAIIGGLMSEMTGEGFASGAVGAGLNEALIKAIQGQDPGTAQIISAIIGAAAAKAVGGSVGAGASAAASGTKWNLLAEYHIPKQIGVNIKYSTIGHMGIMVEVEGGSYDSADYGRYGDDIALSSGEFRAPIGHGTVITRWYYNPDEKYNYILNTDAIDPSATVSAYNSWIKEEGYRQLSNDDVNSIFYGKKDQTELENSQYYRNGSETDYNLLSNNCATTTLRAIFKGNTYKNLLANITLARLSNAYDPSTIKEILDEDYTFFKGHGLVTAMAYGVIP
ncbi:hypothetical protein TAMA11512_05320 [Selenomonas sp. TAMA-11512]|nr:hypothetical protein TAMA11512_05320 [Selenomonas sp. TAMA-11512]